MALTIDTSIGVRTIKVKVVDGTSIVFEEKMAEALASLHGTLHEIRYSSDYEACGVSRMSAMIIYY